MEIKERKGFCMHVSYFSYFFTCDQGGPGGGGGAKGVCRDVCSFVFRKSSSLNGRAIKKKTFFCGFPKVIVVFST